MNQIELVEAIRHIKPNAEFSLQDNDYSTIKWDVLEGEAPTLSELETAYQALKAAKAQAKAEAEAKRSAALAKLEVLGLDENDLKALGF